MKYDSPKTGNGQVDAAFKSLDAYLRSLSTDNFKGKLISGTTNSSADTQQMFKHGLGAVPKGMFRIEGDVYVPLNGYGADQVDIRSRLTSHKFSIYVFI